MTILIAALLVACLAFAIRGARVFWFECETILGKIFGIIVVFILTILIASASIVVVYPEDEINVAEDSQRTITVYASDGKVIAEYTGKIGIEWNDGGYVLFDYDGKRYTYYNCFVESIADIE